MYRNVWMPIKELTVDQLKEIVEDIKKDPGSTKKQLRQINFLQWLIDWRGKDHPHLPKFLKYNPAKWDLNEISEHNYPDSVHELGVLFKRALLVADIHTIKFIFRLIVKQGYQYRPGSFYDHTHDELVPVWDGRFVPDDYKILKERGLV